MGGGPPALFQKTGENVVLLRAADASKSLPESLSANPRSGGFGAERPQPPGADRRPALPVRGADARRPNHDPTGER